MFNRKKMTPRKVKNIQARFDSFEKVPEPSKNQRGKDFFLASECYNYKVENGVLEDGYGFRDFVLPMSYDDLTEEAVKLPSDEVKKIWSFRWFDPIMRVTDSYVFYLDGNDKLYYFLEYRFFDEYVTDTTVSFTSEPTCFAYRMKDVNMFILSSATDDLVVYAGADTAFVFENMPKLADACIHENCLYAILATDDSKIIYTNDLKFPETQDTEFTELVFIGGEGHRLRKLISLNDYVYVFRDNGIVRVYPYGMTASLSISHVYYSTSFIMPETIQRCGDEILYLTREGLYSFNGTTSTKIELEITDKIDMEHYETFVSASQKGKYFIACRMKFDDDETVLCEGSSEGYNNNAVLIYDVESGCVEVLRGVDVRDFEAFETHSISKMLCCFYHDNKSKMAELTTDGKVFGEIVPKRWTSVKTDFGYEGQYKVIRSVELTAIKDCTIEIETENGKKSFKVKGNTKLQKIRLGVKGEWFKISFVSREEGQKISSPEFDIDVLL